MKSQLKSRLNLKSMIIARLGAVDGGMDSGTAQLSTYCISWKYRLITGVTERFVYPLW